MRIYDKKVMSPFSFFRIFHFKTLILSDVNTYRRRADMKATGIVRRIDDLGRVVIPKEIRRTLRIREGDPFLTTLTPIHRFIEAIERIFSHASDTLGEK